MSARLSEKYKKEVIPVLKACDISAREPAAAPELAELGALLKDFPKTIDARSTTRLPRPTRGCAASGSSGTAWRSTI